MIFDDNLWQELTSELRSDTGIVRRRIQMPNGANVFIAMLSPSGLPALLVETDCNNVPSTINVNCQGFTLKSGQNQLSDLLTSTCLLLELADSKFRDVFLVLVKDILNKMYAANSESQSVRTFLSQLSRWQGFFNKHGQTGLTTQEQHGLWGELWALKNVLATNIGLSTSILAWEGPEGANQDFAFDDLICEVKTSVSPPHEKFQVSNVLQLDSSSSTVFIVLFLAIETRQSTLCTLSQLVEEIRSVVAETNPQLLDIFNTKLIHYGYLKIHEEYYNKTGYLLRHSILYLVSDDFPRILEKDLPNGVGDVKYSISNAACTGFVIESEKIKELIKPKGEADE
jgi:hypothetical protein